MLNYCTIALISHASKVMLKILQASAVCEPWTSWCSSWFSNRQRNQRSNCQHTLDHRKSKRVPEKHLFLLYWLCQSLWLCSVQLLSCVWLFVMKGTAACQVSLSITNSQSTLKIMSIKSVNCQLSQHPLLFHSPPVFNLSQHQGLFQWLSSSHQVAKGLEFQLQHQSFQWTPRTDLL